MAALGKVYRVADFLAAQEVPYHAALSAAAAAPSGRRTTTLFRQAAAIGRMIGDGIIDRHRAERDLLHAARSCGLTEAESAGHINSGLTKGAAGRTARNDNRPVQHGPFAVIGDDPKARERANPDRDTAARIHGAARPLAGSPGAAYLAARGITTAPDSARWSIGHACITLPYTLPDGSIQSIQRIPLRPDGSHTNPQKKRPFSRGTLQNALFVIPATATDGPSVLADGPEDAMAAHQATGWRAFASGGKTRFRHVVDHLEPGEWLIAVRDADGTDNSEYEPLSRAAAAKGINLLFVDPPGEAKDANDVLRAGGDEAVRAWLGVVEAQAPPEPASAKPHLPPYYPASTEPREAALARQRHTITAFIAEALGATVARVEALRRRAELTTPDLLPWQKGQITKAVNAEVRAEFGVVDLDAAGRRLFVSGSQGSGKSRAAGESIAAIQAALAVWWLAPTLAKAEEQAAEYRDRYARPGSLPGCVVRGRAAIDPESADGAAMCPRHVTAQKVSEAGLSVAATLCPTCPHSDACGYLRQEREIAAMGGRGVFFGSHQYAFLPASPAPSPDLAVIDESVTSIASGARIILDPEVLDTVAGFGGRLDYQFPVRAILAAVRKALTGPNALDAMRAAGVTDDGLSRVIHILELNATQDAESALSCVGADHEIIDRLDAVELRNCRKVAGLLRLIRRELPRQRSTFNAVRFDAAYVIKIDSKTVKAPRILGFPGRDLKIPREVPILHLDGTGDVSLVRKIFGEVEHVHVPVERLARVTGTTSKNYSRQSILGADSLGRPHRPEEAARLRADLAAIAGHMPGPVFVGGCKAVVERLVAEGLPLDHGGWFGAVRGMNAWEDRSSALIVGREQPSARDVEDQSRPFLADDDEPLLPAAGYVIQTRGRRTAGGVVEAVDVEVHPDPRVQGVLEQIREAEIAQAMDRVRAIYNFRHIALLNELALDVTYDRTRRHADLVAGGERWERALDRHGVLPLKPAEMRRLWPDLWDSERAARRESEKVITPLFQNKNLLFWERGVITPVAYRIDGQRGPHPTRALVDLRRHPDPAAALSALLGYQVTLVDPVAPAVPAPTPAAPPTETPFVALLPTREAWAGWGEDADPLDEWAA